MNPVDSWLDVNRSSSELTREPTAHDEAMLRSYGFDRAIDYGMSIDDLILLDKRVRNGADWVKVLQYLARDHTERAKHQLDQGHVVSAKGFQLQAASCLRLAQAGSEDDVDRRITLYEQQAQAFSAAVLLDESAVKLDIRFRGKSHRGWLARPAHHSKLTPFVLVWGGADGWCEAFWRSVPTFLERGLAVCLIELPGQGLARLRFGSFLDCGFSGMVSETIDQLGDAGLNARRVGVVGHSLGGTLAIAAAGSDPRILACVSNGGLLRQRTEDKFPRATRRMERMLGLGGAANDFFASLNVPSHLQSMNAKLLCIQGGQDVLVSTEQAHEIVDLRGSGDASLSYWPDGVHCIYNHAIERNVLIADWISRVLLG